MHRRGIACSDTRRRLAEALRRKAACSDTGVKPLMHFVELREGLLGQSP